MATVKVMTPAEAAGTATDARFFFCFMERPGKLMTMNKAKLAHAQRQFTIAVLL